MRSRPFLTRLLLAALGMLLLCAAGVIGVGWAVRGNIEWDERILGEARVTSLRGVYVRALGRLFPADRDGDGFPDSEKWYLDADPSAPLQHPPASFLEQENQGFKVAQLEPAGPDRHWSFSVAPGERRRVRARLGICDAPGVFAPGMRILVSQQKSNYHYSDPSMLCLPGGTPGGESYLPLTVAADGTVELDVVVPESAGTSTGKDWLLIDASHPQSKQTVGAFYFGIIQRRASIPFTVQQIPEPASWSSSSQILRGPVVRLDWQADDWHSADSGGMYLVEATRDEGEPAEWVPAAVCPLEENYAVISYELNDSKPGARGPLRFRVIATKPKWVVAPPPALLAPQ